MGRNSRWWSRAPVSALSPPKTAAAGVEISSSLSTESTDMNQKQRRSWVRHPIPQTHHAFHPKNGGTGLNTFYTSGSLLLWLSNTPVVLVL